MKPIYLDFAATTPVDDGALAAALPYMKNAFYNPSSTHRLGREAYCAAEKARQKVAAAIGADEKEIIFTSGGTEAVEQAMLCTPFNGKNTVIVSAIEHESVLSCADILKKRGVNVLTLPPTRGGTVTPELLEKVINDDTALVCVMTVNNQTGAIQPISELAAVAHGKGALLFSDAVQAVTSVDIDVRDSGADLLAASAHKFYSLKGAGFLYVKRGIKISPLMVGGGQEYGLRAGTLNVPAIVAMGEAIEIANKSKNEYIPRISGVENAFLGALTRGKPVYVDNKAAGIVSVVFDGINGGRLAVALSMAGVCCSVGSACSSGSATPPPALVAMGVDGAENAVRFSFGRTTTAEEAIVAARIVNATADNLAGQSQLLRQL